MKDGLARERERRGETARFSFPLLLFFLSTLFFFFLSFECVLLLQKNIGWKRTPSSSLSLSSSTRPKQTYNTNQFLRLSLCLSFCRCCYRPAIVCIFLCVAIPAKSFRCWFFSSVSHLFSRAERIVATLQMSRLSCAIAELIIPHRLLSMRVTSFTWRSFVSLVRLPIRVHRLTALRWCAFLSPAVLQRKIRDGERSWCLFKVTISKPTDIWIIDIDFSSSLVFFLGSLVSFFFLQIYLFTYFVNPTIYLLFDCGTRDSFAYLRIQAASTLLIFSDKVTWRGRLEHISKREIHYRVHVFETIIFVIGVQTSNENVGDSSRDFTPLLGSQWWCLSFLEWTIWQKRVRSSPIQTLPPPPTSTRPPIVRTRRCFFWTATCHRSQQHPAYWIRRIPVQKI